MALGPLHSEQFGSGSKPTAPAGSVFSDCSRPQLKHRPAQANDGIRVCTLGGGYFYFHTLQFGMAERKPFTSDMSVHLWRALPMDKTERRELRKKLKGWKISQDGTRLTSAPGPFPIARDSAGRVLQSVDPTALDVSDSASYRSGIPCDPLAEKMISFAIAEPLPPSAGQRSSGDFLFPKPSVTWFPLSEDIHRTRRWGSAENGWKVLDLGYQELNGVRAHGHRWWYAPAGNFVEGNFRELWISADLDVDVLYIEESQTKGKGTRVELTHVRLKEPDHSLFEIPERVPANTYGGRPSPEPCPVTPSNQDSAPN